MSQVFSLAVLCDETEKEASGRGNWLMYGLLYKSSTATRMRRVVSI